jgi:hypothetical protein
MNRVLLIKTSWLTPELVELLRRLLSELGFQVELLDAKQEEVIGADLAPGDVLMVVIDDALDQDVPACRVISESVRRGVRTIGVWPPGRSDSHLPTILNRTASGTVPCHRDALATSLRDTGGQAWLEPDGKSRPEQPMKRGGC